MLKPEELKTLLTDIISYVATKEKDKEMARTIEMVGDYIGKYIEDFNIRYRYDELKLDFSCSENEGAFINKNIFITDEKGNLMNDKVSEIIYKENDRKKITVIGHNGKEIKTKKIKVNTSQIDIVEFMTNMKYILKP